MQRSPIQWTDYTTNPIRARRRGSEGRSGHYCEKISKGCGGCYASRMQPRFGLPQFQEQRKLDDIELFLSADELGKILRHKKPGKVFWCDMTDMFGAWVPDEWIAACFGVMAATPHLMHQVLTKRAKRMRELLTRVETGRVTKWGRFAGMPLPDHGWLQGRVWQQWSQAIPAQLGKPYRLAEVMPWPLPNVHLGVSIEDPDTAVERVPELRATPAAARFLSMEPLLEYPHGLDLTGIDWAIIGGESGPKARPFDVAWARRFLAACRASGTAPFVKQLGKKPFETVAPCGAMECQTFCPHAVLTVSLADGHGGDINEWPADIRVREFPR